eukprot:m.341965 g.341965  ORF g.341965 m.341965 type:complete len:557 (+) comp20716_c0_seq1:293-1963(+)
MGKKSFFSSLFSINRNNNGAEKKPSYSWQAPNTPISRLRLRREALLASNIGSNPALLKEWDALIKTLDHRTRATLDQQGYQKADPEIAPRWRSRTVSNVPSSPVNTQTSKARSFLSEFADSPRTSAFHIGHDETEEPRDSITEGLLPGATPRIQVFRDAQYNPIEAWGSSSPGRGNNSKTDSSSRPSSVPPAPLPGTPVSKHKCRSAGSSPVHGHTFSVSTREAQATVELVDESSRSSMGPEDNIVARARSTLYKMANMEVSKPPAWEPEEDAIMETRTPSASPHHMSFSSSPEPTPADESSRTPWKPSDNQFKSLASSKRTLSQEEAFVEQQKEVTQIWSALANARKYKVQLLAKADKIGGEMKTASLSSQNQADFEKKKKAFERVKSQITEVDDDIKAITLKLEAMGYMPSATESKSPISNSSAKHDNSEMQSKSTNNTESKTYDRSNSSSNNNSSLMRNGNNTTHINNNTNEINTNRRPRPVVVRVRRAGTPKTLPNKSSGNISTTKTTQPNSSNNKRGTYPIPWNNPDKRILGRKPKPTGSQSSPKRVPWHI